MLTTKPMTIPPLISGGIMLTYRCTNACKHCLYRCSPRHERDFMSESMLDATMAALAKESALHGIHLAGGEATLDWKRLLYAVRAARRHGIAIDYLETNASWCEDERTAHEGFSRLHEAGLGAVLISASLFHNEFIPLARTKTAIRAATEVFGRRGVIVWTPEVLHRMDSRLEDHRAYPLAESAELLGLAPGLAEIWRLHGYLTPGGRAAEQLAHGLPARPADSFQGDACRRTLENTTHFHIDPFGNLFTGHCPGIAAANIGDLHPAIDPDRRPVYSQLAEGGPVWLWRGLADDFVPSRNGYVSKCHLCLEIRKHLRSTGRYDELRPEEYYRE